MAKLVRGNFDPTLIKGASRQGASGVVMMFDPSSGTTAGDSLMIGPNGDAIDSGAPASHFADAETPSGALNGTNQTYTLAHTPVTAASLRLYANGVLLLQGTDYTLATATITLTNLKPNSANNEWLLAYYRY